MKTSVLVLTPDAAEYLPHLDRLHGASYSLAAASTANEALHLDRPFDIILGQPDQAAALLASGAAVSWVQSTWAGVTPLLELGRDDYVLTGVKDTFGPQISEYVFGYLLAREIKLLERLGRQAHKHWWQEPSGTLCGKTLGVMGCGSIGSHVGRTGRHFGMQTVGLSRSGREADGFDRVYSVESLPGFLARPDFLVCALPETPETRGLLGAREFALMKPGCFLVNVGRGSLIDEKALIDALEDGRLAGAALDVFSEEPLPEDSALWHAENALVTAHIAAKSRPADIARIFLANLERFRQGAPLEYLIDFDLGY
jgi:phosphoglycerate dehydrogenase-like enzyme